MFICTPRANELDVDINTSASLGLYHHDAPMCLVRKDCDQKSHLADARNFSIQKVTHFFYKTSIYELNHKGYLV